MLSKLLENGEVRPPAGELGIFCLSKHSVSAWRISQEKILRSSAADNETCDAMARQHHAQPASVEMKLTCVCSTRKRVVDNHYWSLQPLETVARLDEYLGQVSW